MTNKSTYYMTKVIDGIPVKLHRVLAHTFMIDNFHDDPIAFASQPMYEWEQSEEGKWVIEHAYEKPVWNKHEDIARFQTQFAITAILRESDLIVWALKS